MPFEQLNIEIIESYITPCFNKLVRLLRPVLRPRNILKVVNEIETRRVMFLFL